MIWLILGPRNSRDKEVCRRKRHQSYASLAGTVVLMLVTFAPAHALPLQEGEAYVSCFPGAQNDRIDTSKPSGGIFDTRNPLVPPNPFNWPAPNRDKVTAGQVGLIFGIAIDDASVPNVYVANSAAFGLHIVSTAGATIAKGESDARWMDGQFGAGSISVTEPQGEPAIYKIDTGTAVPIPIRFGPLTNDGPGFGNIAFNPYTAQANFYVSDFSNGKIYHLDSSGAVMNPGGFDPGGPPDAGNQTNIQSTLFKSNIPDSVLPDVTTPNFPALDMDMSEWGVTQNDRLVWGVGVYKRAGDSTPRLYYSRGRGANAKIFSVSLGSTGNIVGSPIDEAVDLSGMYDENYVSDISFSNNDEMLLAERGLRGRAIPNMKLWGFNFYRAHENRVSRHVWNTGSSSWTRSPLPHYAIGVPPLLPKPPIGQNSTGGVDFTYGLNDEHRTDLTRCDDRFLAMSDGWKEPDDDLVYGLQHSPISTTPDMLNQSYFIDLDGIVSQNAWQKAQNGDVEVFRKSCRASPPPGAILKICKVAGPDVAVGTDFFFNVTGIADPISVPAGPAPGGYCKIVGAGFVEGATVTTDEIVPAGHGVIDITGAPASQLVAFDLALGTADILIGPGVTEVTYTNESRTGFLEVCKFGEVDGEFSFDIQPGNIQTIPIPSGACTPAFEVPAGEITITENASGGSVMVLCGAYPASRGVSCSPDNNTFVVNVPAGDISTQTLAGIMNEPAGMPRSKRRRKKQSGSIFEMSVDGRDRGHRNP